MSIIAKTRSWLLKSMAKAMTLDAYARRWFAATLGGFGSGASAQFSEPFVQSVYIQRCVSMIAYWAGTLPVRIVDRRDTRIETGPLADFIQRPHPTLSWRRFVEATVGYYLVDGECDWIVARRGSRLRPTAITPVSGKRLHLKPGASQAEPVWELDLGDARRESVLDVDVARLHTLNPTDGNFRGIEPVRAIYLAARANHQANVVNDRMIRNGLILNGVFTAPEITDAQEKQLRSEIEKKRGPAHANEHLFLSGNLSWVDMSKTARDMQFAELKQMSVDEILAAYSTPLPLLGTIKDANYKMRDCKEIWLYNALVPVCHLVGEAITEFVASAYGPYTVYIDWAAHPYAREMMREEISSGKDLWAMGVPFEDIDTLFDWGLPDRPWHARGFRAMGLVDAGQTEPDLGPALPEGGDEQDRMVGPEDPPYTEHGRKEKEGGSDDPPTGNAVMIDTAVEQLKLSIWERWAASWRPLEKTFERVLRRVLFRQRTAVLKRLGEFDKAAAGGVAKDLRPADVERLLFDLREENEHLKADVRPVIERGIRGGAEQLADEIGAASAFTLNDPAIGRIMAAKLPKLVGINRTTRRRVAATLTEGIEKHETIAQLAQRVKADYAFSGARAMTIARTETASSVSSGRHAGMAQLGVPKKAWLSARDGTVRESHLAVDRRTAGTPIPTSRPFTVGGYSLMYPGDPAGPPGEIINCRCKELPVVDAKATVADVLAKYADITFKTIE